eukprot:298441_1
MTPINISFMLCLFIFRTQVAKDIEISTCDTICITNSLRSDVDGTYRFKYFNSTLNGAVYYNSANQYYLNPTIYSDNLYYYAIQSHNGIPSSMCAIYNPTSGYIFDPYDCFKGWSTYEDDEWKDDPNQRLANCNDVTVSGNYRSGLDGTYEWSHPDGGSTWKISHDYSSTSSWSHCTFSNGISNRRITMNDCTQWKSVKWSGSTSTWVADTDLVVESENCPGTYVVSISSFPNSIITISVISALLVFILTSVRQKQRVFKKKTNIPVNVLYITISVLVFNTLLWIMAIVAIIDDFGSVHHSDSTTLDAFAWTPPIAHYCICLVVDAIWYESYKSGTKCMFRTDSCMNGFFGMMMLLISFCSFGVFVVCGVNGDDYVSEMMLVYFVLSLLIAALMAYDWRHLKKNKDEHQPLIVLHQNAKLQQKKEELKHSAVKIQREKEQLRRSTMKIQQEKKQLQHSTAKLQREKEELRRKVSLLSERSDPNIYCILCCERKANIFNDPCGHVTYCRECSSIIEDNKCPSCRQVIYEFKQLYNAGFAQ